MKLRLVVASAVAALALVGCCKDGKCIKDPPCKCGENPCCLTPVQKAALGAGSHALPAGPRVWAVGDKVFILFTEKGEADFEKDPVGYDEKGAIRLIRKGKVYRVDVNPKDAEPDWAALAAQAVPYTAPTK